MNRTFANYLLFFPKNTLFCRLLNRGLINLHGWTKDKEKKISITITFSHWLVGLLICVSFIFSWFFRWLLAPCCHRLPNTEWEAAVPCCPTWAELLWRLRWHLSLPGKSPPIREHPYYLNIALQPLFLLNAFSFGAMATGLMWSLMTASPLSTTSWFSLSRLKGMNFGVPCWRRPTLSESF